MADEGDNEDDKKRLISGKKRPEDQDQGLRPQYLKDVIGQEKVVGNLKIMVDAAKARKEPLGHILFHGPPGIGKTTLSHVMAKEMGVNIRITSGPAVERAGDLAAILTNLHAGDVLFIDEIHRLGKAIEEIMYSAMEDFVLDIVVGKGPGAKNVRLTLPKFTAVGATTRLDLLTPALRSRFDQVMRLDFYELPPMIEIVTRAARLIKVPIDPDGAREVASRARGTPRIALRLLKWVRDYAQARVQGSIDEQVAKQALDMIGVDYLGLDDVDRRVLLAIIDKFEGGPVGLDTVAASISEEPGTIMDVYEPFLLQLGFIKRMPRGRVATRAAYDHLGRGYNGSASQEPLF